MNERANLTNGLSSDEFKDYYYLKEELVDFLRKEGLKTSGNKAELTERISYYLETGKEKISPSIPSKNNIIKVKDININDKIGENFKCTQEHRKFFEEEIGKSFAFKVKFQNWLKENADKTFKDSVEAYYNILENNKNNKANKYNKSKIDKQFEYNQYIRDFFQDNKGKTLEDAIKSWNYKKSRKGNNKYNKEDLIVLK